MIQKLTRQDSFTDFVAELIGQPNLSLALGAFLIGLLGNVLASALGDWYLWLIPGHWIIIIGLALAVVGLYFQYVRRKRTVVIEMQDNQPTGKAGVILLLSTLNPPTGGTAAENQQRRAEVEATITHIRESASENLTPADFALLNNTNLTPALRALEWHAQAGALRECWLLGTPDESRTDGTLQHGSAWLAPVLQRWFELLHPRQSRRNQANPVDLRHNIGKGTQNSRQRRNHAWPPSTKTYRKIVGHGVELHASQVRSHQQGDQAKTTGPSQDVGQATRLPSIAREPLEVQTAGQAYE